MSDIVERMRDREKHITAVSPYKLLVEAADEITRLRSELSNARNASWDAGYLAGFKASGEGWNGEYPFDGTDPVEDALWLERRNTYRVLAARKAEGESR